MGEESGPMNPDTGTRTDALPAADDPTVIRAEIAQTRAEMAETIDAIQDKLSPQRVMEQAKDTVREATIGKVKEMANTAGETASGVAAQVQEGAQQAVEYVKDNPWPALLIGAGVTWMLLSQRSQRPYYTQSRLSGRPQPRRPEPWRPPSQSTGYVQQTTGSVQRAVGDMTDQVQESWQHYSTRAEGEFQRWMRENPLTVGAAAVALGAAVGLSAPRTRTEDAWMGEARDQLIDRAQEVAEDTVQKAQQVVDVAQDTVQQAQQAVRSNETGGSAGPRL